MRHYFNKLVIRPTAGLPAPRKGHHTLGALPFGSITLRELHLLGVKPSRSNSPGGAKDLGTVILVYDVKF